MFRTKKRLWVINISILPLIISFKMGASQPQILHLQTNFFRQEEDFPTIFRQPKTASLLPGHDATPLGVATGDRRTLIGLTFT